MWNFQKHRKYILSNYELALALQAYSVREKWGINQKNNSAQWIYFIKDAMPYSNIEGWDFDEDDSMRFSYMGSGHVVKAVT